VGLAVERDRADPEQLPDTPVDAVVVQRPHEMLLAERWLGGRRLGTDVPVVWLEHNGPDGSVSNMRHPAADRRDVTVVHVTHTNALYWDTGNAHVVVIEHGVAKPAPAWTGIEPNVGVVVNEPVRRNRITGTDLLPRFGAVAPLHVFGMASNELVSHFDAPKWLQTFEDLPQATMHRELAQRRCYLHPFRWTSLGLSLIEAMAMGMPVVALATTDVPAALTRDCGAVSNDLRVLEDAITTFITDPELAAQAGAHSRRRAAERYGLERFLDDWNHLLESV
jgi:glycosyltransferase involved in cell wall biosynthesis